MYLERGWIRDLFMRFLCISEFLFLQKKRLDANNCSYMDTDYEERYGLTDLSIQSLLMNHTGVVGSVAVHIDAAQKLSYLGLPYTLNEVNGMALQGGAWTWSMGSALWVVDFALWSATNVSHRRHHAS